MSKEKKNYGGQRFAASNYNRDVSKVEDLATKPHRTIGFYIVASPKRYIAFDAKWNRLGSYYDQSEAKHVIITSYKICRNLH